MKNITKGICTLKPHTQFSNYKCVLFEGIEIFSIANGKATDEQQEANAELIAEAFNVTNESGLTPRQLLEQRNELLDALKIAKDKIDLLLLPLDRINNKAYQTISQAIKNATNQEV